MKKLFFAPHRPLLFALLGLFITSAIVVSTSCNKKFDAPPLESTDTPVVTMTIKELKAMHTVRGAYDSILTDGVISGIVTANDSTGNFYQEIVIQDNSGGIAVSLSGNSLYTDFPLGRKVFISINGLTMGDYGGSIQLGKGISTSVTTGSKRVGGITSTLVPNYITKGTFSNVVIPVSISDLKTIDTTMQSPLSNVLVTFDSFQFAAKDTLATYGYLNKTAQDSGSRYFYLQNCAGQEVELYNSSYAYFATLTVPKGKGNITGIYTKFNTTKEILIRDTSDVKFYGPRCGGGSGPVGNDTTSISDVRKVSGTIPANTIIKGIVISNANNEAAGNMRIEAEDGSAGVILYFNKGSNSSFTVGQEIAVNVGGLKIAPFNGDLEISGVQTATVIGNGTITPRIATIADIKKNMNEWTSTLVTIKDVTIKRGGAGDSGESDTLSDATAEGLVTFIRNSSGIKMPAKAGSITGYVSIYQKSGADATAQLGLRDQKDLSDTSSDTQPPTGAGFTAKYDFANSPGSVPTDPTTPPTVSGLTFGNFGSAGATAAAGAGRFSFTGWPLGATTGSDDFTGQVDLTKYLDVTITPASGKTLDLSGITFTIQRSGTGVRQAVVRSSIDDYANNLPATIKNANTNLSIANTNIIQVSDAVTNAQDGSTITLGSNFANITSAVTFRFYGFNAESGGGTFSIDNVEFRGSVK